MENLFFNIEPSELDSACGLPAKLHPASANALEHLLANDLPWEEFARLFSLPNSFYIPMAECIRSFIVLATLAAL